MEPPRDSERLCERDRVREREREREKEKENIFSRADEAQKCGKRNVVRGGKSHYHKEEENKNTVNRLIVLSHGKKKE